MGLTAMTKKMDSHAVVEPCECAPPTHPRPYHVLVGAPQSFRIYTTGIVEGHYPNSLTRRLLFRALPSHS